MPFKCTIPISDSETREISINIGQSLFVLGANGTGKSSLMHALYVQNEGVARRIISHRQTWLIGDGTTMSSTDRQMFKQQLQSDDRQNSARFRDDYASQRASMVVHDLIEAENVRARAIAAAMDGDKIEVAKELSGQDSPIAAINRLLKISNMPISIKSNGTDGVKAQKSDGPEFGISKLSDGERNAILLAAGVLTCPADSIFFIDEPERHLHRSIISPFLSELFSLRKDCAFVVSTHEVMLPVDNPSARTILVRSCTYVGDAPSYWDIDIVEAGADIGEETKREILGGRRDVLFVEGTNESLDKPFYSILFPSASVIAKSTCKEVQSSVATIRSSDKFHWMRVFGIVDGDNRPQKQVGDLLADSIMVVPAIAIEAIYYHPMFRRKLAERQSTITGDGVDGLLAKATGAAIDEIRRHIDRLCGDAVVADIRHRVMVQLPKAEDVGCLEPIEIFINIPELMATDRARLVDACDRGDIDSILARYAVRTTGGLKKIAENLGFQGRRQYEKAVRKLLTDDQLVLDEVRSWFAPLPSLLEIPGPVSNAISAPIASHHENVDTPAV